ncbi:MAG TPA: nuclear transport factor 2 family protein [Steroidobacteraceae bacterium]|jgi:ketosteroid isomerase-like protein
MSDDIAFLRLCARLDTLESQVAIRAIMTQYMHLCDSLDATTPMQEIGELFTVDAVWSGTGARYGAAFGEHRGRESILAMLEAYRTPPHFQLNAHFLTSETIIVDTDTARAGWMMLQTSTYTSGASDLRSARLTVDFKRADGRWRISRFVTANLFSRPVDYWDDPAPTPVPTGAHK